MLVGDQLQHIARQLRQLIECDSVIVLLGCPEQDLRHPLLDDIPIATTSYYPAGHAGSVDDSALLQDEHVQALCDIAIQSGQIQRSKSISECMLADSGNCSLQSIAVAPLERPAGVLGVVLLADRQVAAFGAGDHLLLRQYLPQISRRLEEDVKHLNHEFLSMVSHEIRAPLSAIKGYAALLQAYGCWATGNQDESGAIAMTPRRQREYLDIIMEQTNHLEVLIGDLLDVSRIHTGRIKLRATHINIADLCQHVKALMQRRIDQQSTGKYEIRCVLPPDLPPIWADADRVQQVLVNLLDNAIKYSPDGGLIEVRASTSIPHDHQPGSSSSVQPGRRHNGLLSQEAQARMLYITVCDQGIGIPHEQYRYLFKPFSRLEYASSLQIPGAGLGLYISQKLVEAMHGTISLSSNQGKGTSVTVAFPVTQPERNIPTEQKHIVGKSAALP